MKTSLVIPSTNNHFHYVDCILKHYAAGTVRPDEVIISISNGHLMDVDAICNLQNKYENSFDTVNIVSHNMTVPEGPNRGFGSRSAKNEIIIYQDSDDIPHPQRIEIIKHFFKNENILHLNHSFTFAQEFNQIKIDSVRSKNSSDLFSLYFSDFLNVEQDKRIRQNRPRKVYGPAGNSLPYGSGFGWSITGGSTAIKKEVLEKINWEWNMDVSYDYDFCMDTLFYYNKSMIIDSPLIWYNKISNMKWACR
tara:strand:- start:62435 stop:63184 length:750 start_codon:yes stop_codon:yes gene_type:complete